MKLRLLLTTVLLLFTNTIFSQGLENIIYSSRDVRSKIEVGKYDYVVTYNYTFAMDTVSEKRYTDVKNLEIGKDISHYYSRNSDICDSIIYRDSKSGKQSLPWPRSWLKNNMKAIPEDVYFHLPQKGVLTVDSRIVYTEYEYTEPLYNFQWTMIPDITASVIGYECKAADVCFRGRCYRAYFTLDIPLSYGPFKFCGLPGLILKIEEKSGLFKWEAIGIVENDGIIYKYENEALAGVNDPISDMDKRIITRKQLQVLAKKIWDDPVGLLLQHGQQFGDDRMTGKKEKFRKPYIPPLELE